MADNASNDPLDLTLTCPGYTHPAAIAEDELLKACDIKHTRGSGPGGQHRNKTQTAIVITHQPTGIQGAASERRSQQENLRMAVRRLRLNLAVNHRLGVTLRWVASVKDTRDDAGDIAKRWSARVRSRRISLSEQHADYPALLAWVMDVLWDKQLSLPDTAAVLGVTSSQLLKLLKSHGPALVHFNEARLARGMAPLK